MQEDHNSEDSSNEEPVDRPLECSQCRKPIKVLYTEIVGDSVHRVAMCEDCPNLQQRLRGAATAKTAQALSENAAGLCCGNCGTTLEAVQMGHPLGCSECYSVFADLILKELVKAGKAPARLAASKSKKMPAHIGRSPGEVMELSPSIQLIALNEALHETLNREDYEQAAWIRDQIKALTEETGGEQEKK